MASPQFLSSMWTLIGLNPGQATISFLSLAGAILALCGLSARVSWIVAKSHSQGSIDELKNAITVIEQRLKLAEERYQDKDEALENALRDLAQAKAAATSLPASPLRQAIITSTGTASVAVNQAIEANNEIRKAFFTHPIPNMLGLTIPGLPDPQVHVIERFDRDNKVFSGPVLIQKPKPKD
jgi:hypothetical protein